MMLTNPRGPRLAFLRAAAIVGVLSIGGCDAPQDQDSLGPTAEPTNQFELSPASGSIAINERIQFQVHSSRFIDESEVLWSASGGAIDGQGAFTAGAPGIYKIFARWRRKHWIKDRDRDSVVVIVTPPSVIRLAVAPDSTWLAPSGTQAFRASAYFSDGTTVTPAPTVRWTATGGSIDSVGMFTAGTVPGSYGVVATAGSLADTVEVTVADPPPVTSVNRVMLTPASVTLQPGTSQAFAAAARLSDGTTAPVAVTYSAAGGTITPAGLYKAGQAPGKYQVIAAAANGKADTSSITVASAVPTVQKVTLTPATVSLAASATQQFATTVTMSDTGATTPTVTYSVTGGTVTSGGMYTSGDTPGTFRVIAAVPSGEADTAVVTISSPSSTLAQVILAPSTVTLQPGASHQFSASGRTEDGKTEEVQVVYTADGGTVTPTGLYVAGSTPGNYRVIARLATGTLADTGQVTIAQAGSGTTLYPGQDIQAAVNSFPAGTSFLLKAGTHRMQSITPKDGMTFAGEPGTIVSGARVLDSWTRQGGYWVASGQTQQGRVESHCYSDAPACGYPEDLFKDDALLEHVTSLGGVAPGKWYFDYGADKVYVADDPSGRRMEIGVTPQAFGGSASNVTLRGLIVEKYATPTQSGAIQASGNGWVIQDNEVRWNHGTGIRGGSGGKIVHNNIHHNGQMGIGGWGQKNMLVQDNEIAWNNTAGYSDAWEAGGTKFAGTDHVSVINNHSHDNFGPGLWSDIDNTNILYDGNLVEHNSTYGIEHEIGFSAVIRNNRVLNNGGANGYSLCGGVSCAGIFIQNSSGAEVAGNTVEGNYNGIVAIEQSRGSSAQGMGAYITRNNSIHDNTVSMSRGVTGLSQQTGDNTAFTSGAKNVWTNNHYTLKGSAEYFVWQGGNKSDAEWKAVQDAGATITRQ